MAIINNNRQDIPDNDPTNQQGQEQESVDISNTPIGKTIGILGQPNGINDKGVPVYDYMSLTSKFDNNHLAWARQSAKLNGSDIEFSLPSSSYEEFAMSKFIQNGIPDPNAIATVPASFGGIPIVDKDNNQQMIPNPEIRSIMESSKKEWDNINRKYDDFSNTLEMLSNDEYEYDKLNKVYASNFYGYEMKKTDEAKMKTGEITNIRKLYDNSKTPAQQARENGYIYDSKTGEWEEYGFWDIAKDRSLNTLWNVTTGLYQSVDDGWNSLFHEDLSFGMFEKLGMDKLTLFNIPTIGLKAVSEVAQDWLPEPTKVTVDYDPVMDDYYLNRRSAYDRTVSSSQIYGVFSQGKSNSMFTAGVGQMYNMLNPMSFATRMAGTGSQWLMDAGDLFREGDDKMFYSDDYARAISLQDYATGASYTPSERSMNNPWHYESIGGYIGSAVGIALTMQFGAVKLNSLTAEGSNIANAIGKISPKIAKSGAVRMAPATSLLSVQETAQFNQELNDLGMPREYAVFALPAFFGMTMGIEQFGSNIMLKETKLGSKVFAKEIIENTTGVNKSSGFKKFIRNTWLGRPENIWQAYSTMIVEEGIEEGGQQWGSNVFKGIGDYIIDNEMLRREVDYKTLYDGGYISTPDKQTFFEHENGDNFMTMALSNSGDGVFQAAVIGALSSIPMGLVRQATKGQMYYKDSKDKTIIMGSLNGQGKEIINAAENYNYKGRLGSVTHGYANGDFETLVPKSETNKDTWISENDWRLEQIKNEVAIADYFVDKITDEEKAALNDDINLVGTLIATKRTIAELEEKIAKLQTTSTEEADMSSEIESLETQLAEAKETYKAFTEFEPGSKFSKAYNESISMAKSRYIFARNFANEKYAEALNIKVEDITEKHYTTNLYNKIHTDAKNMIDLAAYEESESRTKNKEKLNKAYEEAKRITLSKSAEGVISQSEDIYKDLLPMLENMPKKGSNEMAGYLKSVSSIMGKINGLQNNYKSIGLADSMTERKEGEKTYTEAFGESFTNIKKTMTDLNSKLSEIGMEYDVNEPEGMNVSSNPINEKAPGVTDYDGEPSEQIYRESIGRASDYFNSDFEFEESEAEYSNIEINNRINDAKEDLKNIDYSDEKAEETKKGIEENIKSLKLKLLTTENDARYFMSLEKSLQEIEAITAKGIRNSLKDPDIVAGDLKAVKDMLKLSDKIAMYDHYSNYVVEQRSKNKDLTRPYDYNLNKEQFEAVKEKINSYENRIDKAMAKVYDEKGVGEHNIITALNARLQVQFFRDMFTNGMPEKDKDINREGTIDKHLEEKLGNEKYKTWHNLLNQIITYSTDAKGKKKGRFDYDKEDVASPIRIDANGNKRGMLSELGLKETEELLSKIFLLEDFMKENDKIFFSEEIINIVIPHLNKCMYGLGGKGRFSATDPLQDLRSNIQTKYGYHNCKFDNNQYQLTAIDLLKGAAIKDRAGYSSLVKDVEVNGPEKIGKITDGIKYIDADNLQSFSYKWAINYFSIIAGYSSNQMFQDQYDRLKQAQNDDTEISTTFEQMYSSAQTASFFKGGNIVFSNILKAERKYFIDLFNQYKKELNENGRLAESKDVNLDIVKFYDSKIGNGEISNAVTITGDLASGKTETLKYSLEKILESELKNKKEVVITVSANNSDLMNKNKKLILDYFNKKYPGNKIDVIKVNSRNILKESDKTSNLVVLDEASLLTDEFFNSNEKALSDVFKMGKDGKKLIMLGDPFQMSSISTSFESLAFKKTFITTPLVTRFRSGLAITNTVADHFRARINNRGLSLNDPMPEVRHVVNENGTKLGVKYYKDGEVSKIVDEFINDNTDVSKALIIPSNEYISRPEYSQLVERTSDGKLVIKEKYKPYVKVIIDDLLIEEQPIASVQGLDAEHLYIAFDYKWIQNSKQMVNNVAPKAMYTSVGRVADKDHNANYIAMVGDPKRIAGKEVLNKLDFKSNRNIEAEIEFTKNLANKKVRETVTNNEVIEDVSNKEMFIEDGFYRTGESKGYEYYARKVDNHTERIKVKDGKILQRSSNYSITTLDDNSKPITTYNVYISYDEKGTVKSFNVFDEKGKVGLSEVKQFGDFLATLNNNNDAKLKLSQMGLNTMKNIDDGIFIVNDLDISNPLWSNVIKGTYDKQAIEFLKENKNYYATVYVEDSNSETGNLSYFNNEYKLDYTEEITNKVITKSLTIDEAIAYVNQTLVKSSSVKQRSIIVGDNEDHTTPKDDPTNASIDTPVTHDKTNVVLLPNQEYLTLGDAVIVNDKPMIVKSIENDVNDISSGNIVLSNGDENRTLTIPEISKIINDNGITPVEDNIDNKEDVIVKRTRTNMVADGSKLPVYFYGRSIQMNIESVKDIPTKDVSEISYIIQNLKQNLLRDGYKNINLVLKKDFSYISDSGTVVEDSKIVFALKGESSKNIKALVNVISNNIENLDDKARFIEMYDKHSVIINESLKYISVSENLNLYDVSGKLNSLETIKESINTESTDATSKVFADAIEKFYTQISNYANSKSNDEVTLGETKIAKINQKHGLSSDNNKDTKENAMVLENADEFIAKQEARGFRLKGIELFPTNNMKLARNAFSFVFKSLYKTTAPVIAMPKKINSFNTSKSNSVVNEMATELTKIRNNYKGPERIIQLNNSKFFQMIMTNWNQVNIDSKIWNEFLTLKTNDGRPRISMKIDGVDGSNNYAKEANTIKALVKELSDIKFINKFGEYRVPIEYSQKGDFLISKENYKYLDFNVSGINATGFYVDFASVKSNDNINKTKDLKSIIHDNKRGRRTFLKNSNTSYQKVLFSEQAEYLNRVLGDNYNEIVSTVGENTIFTDKGSAYGLYEASKINVEMDKDGYVNPFVLRHEVEHFVLDNMAPEQYRKTINAGRTVMVQRGDYTKDQVDSFTDEQIDEWLAKQYQTYGTDEYTFGYHTNDNLATKILNKFKRFANWFTGYAFGETYLSQLFHSIETGAYANMETNYNNNDDDIRTMPKESDDTLEVDDTEDLLNNESEQKLSEKEMILEEINGDLVVYNSIVSEMKYQIAKNSFVGDGTNSILDAAAELYDMYDGDYSYGKIKVSVEGQEVMLQDLKPEQIQLLSSNDMISLHDYMISKHFNHFSSEVLGQKNIVSSWVHYNQTSESRDITLSMTGMFDVMIAAVKLHNIGPDGRLELDDYVGYLDPATVKRLMKDFSSDIVTMYNNKSNGFNNPLEAAVSFYEKLASSNTRSMEFREDAASFAHFLKNKLEQVKEANEYGKSKGDMSLYIGLTSMLNKLSGTIISTWNKNGIEVFYDKDGKIVTKKLVSSRLSRLRNSFTNNVKKATFDGFGIKETLFNALQGGKRRGKDMAQSISVTSKGVSHLFNGEEIQLIENKDGVFQFTEDAKGKHIDKAQRLFTILGLKTKAHNMVRYIRETNDSFDVIPNYVRSYTNKVAKQQVIAEAIYYMLAASNQYANYKTEKNLIDNARRELDDGDSLTQEMKDKDIEINEKLKNGTFDSEFQLENLKDKTEKFFEKVRDYRKEMDNISDNLDKDQITHGVEVNDDIESNDFYKPSDFLQIFNLMADLEMSYDSKGNSPFIYDRTGNRIPAYGMTSEFLMMAEKKFKLETPLTETANFKIKDGKLVNIHPGNNIESGFIFDNEQKIFSAGENKIVKEPSIPDMIRISFDKYVNSLENQGDTGLATFTEFDIAERQDAYAYDVKSNKRLYTVTENKDTKELKVLRHDEEIVKRFESNMEYYYNVAENASNRMNTILKRNGKGQNLIAYFGSNFNKTGSKYSSFINNLNKELKKSAGKGTKLRLEIMSELYKGFDYDLDSEGNIIVGKAIRFDSSLIWNHDNYSKLMNKQTIEGKNEVIYQDMLQNQYQEFAKQLSKNNYSLNQRYRNIEGYEYDDAKKNTYYTTDNTKFTYNPLVLSFFVYDTLQRPLYDNLHIGDFNHFNSDQQKSKRKKIPTSVGLTGNDSYYGTSNNITRLNLFIHESSMQTLNINGKDVSAPASDGGNYMTLMGTILSDRILGGEFSGESGAIKKSLITSPNIVPGGMFGVKHSAESATDESYYNSDINRNIEKLSMNAWSDKVNTELKENGYDDINYDFYSDFIDKIKTNRETPTEAMNNIYQEILLIEDNVISDIILNNVYSFICDPTTVKTASAGYVPFEITDHKGIDKAYRELDENGTLAKLPVMSFPVNGLKMITNLNQDVTDMRDNVVIPNQFISLMSLLNGEEKYSDKLNDLIIELRTEKQSKISNGIENSSEINKFTENKSRGKLLNYIRNVSIKSLSKVKGMSNISSIVNDKNIDLRIPLITEDVKRVYRGVINREAIRIKTYGFRGTLAPSYKLPLYSSDNGKSFYTLRDIENTFKIDMTESLDKNEIVIGDITFVKSIAQAMRYDNDEFKPTEGILPNPLLKQMDMLKSESLKSIYTFKFIDPVTKETSVVDYQSDDVADISEKTARFIIGAFENNGTLLGFKPANDNKQLHVLYRNNQSVFDDARMSIGEDGKMTATAKKAIVDAIIEFYDTWDKGLNYIDDRVPTGHPGQINIGRIVAFTANGNVAYVPGTTGILSDIDFDGDQNQFYLYNTNKELSNEDIIKNNMFDVMRKAYMDKSNKDKIFHSSNVDTIRKQIISNQSESKNDISSFASMIENASKAQSGATAIPLYANMISSVSELKNYPNTPFTSKVFEDGMDTNRNNGNWLQVALDSPNNIGVGEMGIPNIAVPLHNASLNVFVADEIETIDQLNQSSIDFFKNKYVAEILRNAEYSNRIASYSSGNNLINIIYDNKLKLVNDKLKVTKEQYLKSAKETIALKDKMKSLYSDLGKLLKLENANDFWKIYKNKDLLTNIANLSKYVSETMQDFKYDADTKSDKKINSSKLANISNAIMELIEDSDNIDEKAIKRLVKNTNKDVADIALKVSKIKDEINNIALKLYGTEDVAGHVKIIDAYEKPLAINKMLKLSAIATQTRRFSGFIALRNGIENRSDDLYNQINNLRNSLGMSITEFTNNTATNETTHIAYFKAHNKAYLTSSDMVEMEKMVEVEKLIYNSYNLIDALNYQGMQKYISVLRILEDRYFGNESPFIDEHKAIDAAFDRYTSELFSIPTKQQKVIFDKTIKSFILDAYLNNTKENVSLKSFTTSTDENGILHYTENADVDLENIDLSDAIGREKFKLNFPLLMEFYEEAKRYGKNIIDDSGNNNTEIKETIDLLKVNEFASEYMVMGKVNNRYMSIDGNGQMTDESKQAKERSFKKFPIELQKLIFLYESIRNAYSFKTGSAYDIMPKEMYYDQSLFMDILVNELDEIFNNKKKLDEFKERFVKNVMKDEKSLNFKPSDKKMKALKEGKLVEQKVSPGDGFNKKGHSEYYKIKRNNYEVKSNVNGNPVSSLSASNNYESNPNHDVLTNEIILRSIPIETVNKLDYDFNSDSNENPMYDVSYGNDNTIDTRKTYYTRLGTPIRIYSKNGSKRNFYVSAIGSNKTKASNVLEGLNNPAITKRVSTNRKIATDIVIDKLSKIFPRINVIVETEQTAFDKTGRKDRKAWVSKNGIHVVDGKITADTMIHEITHIWLAMLKENNIQMYYHILNMAKGHMESNTDVTNAISLSYGPMNENSFTEEYIATVSGFNSEESVLSYLAKNYGPETAANKSKGLFNTVKDFVSQIWNSLRSVFMSLTKSNDSLLNTMDLANSTFEDVINAITDDALAGRSIFSFLEAAELTELLAEDENHYSNVIDEVTTLDDFDNLLTRDAENLDIFSNTNTKAEFFLTKLRNDKYSDGYYILYKQKVYKIDKGSRANMVKQIEETVLPDVEFGLNKSLDQLDVIFTEAKNAKQFNDMIFDFIENNPDSNMSYASLKKIYTNSGLSLGYRNIMKYSELKNSEDPNLRMLYEEYTFGNTDPYIIVHGVNANGKLNISIMDITTDSLTARNMNIKEDNLLGAFGVTNHDFKQQGGSFKNNMLGVKQFKLSLLSAHIMRSNPNVQINNVSLFSNPTVNMKFSSLNNIDNIFNNLLIVGKNSDVMSSISNEHIKTILSDKEFLSNEHLGTYMELLAQYLDEDTNIGKAVTEAVQFTRDGRFNEINRTELLSAIEKRMIDIRQTVDSDYDLANNKEYELLGQAFLTYNLRIKRSDLDMANVKDMSAINRMIVTTHNIKNPIAQAFVNAYRKAKTALLESVKISFNKLKDTRNAYYKAHSKDNPGEFTKSKLFNASSKIFEKMYQKVNVWQTINGERMLVKTHVPFLLHYDVNNENTKRALASGEIDMTVVEYGAMIKQIVEDEIIKSIVFDNRAHGIEISENRAKAIYQSTLNKYGEEKAFGMFVMPVIQKTQAEMMFKGISKFAKNTKEGFKDIGEAVSRTLSEAGNDFDMFIDVSTEGDANDITNKFKSQMGNFDSVLRLSGMVVNPDGSLEIKDQAMFNKISTNTEMATGSFILATNRERIFKSMLTPTYNISRILLLKHSNISKGSDMSNTLKWLDEFYATLVQRESPDMKESLPAFEKKIAKLIKYVLRVYSNAVLGLSLRVGAKSFAIMNLTGLMTSVAHKIATSGLNEDEKNSTLSMFDAKSMTKADAFLVKNWSFAWTLARKLQIVDGQEFDLLHNPIYSKTNQHVASDNVLHLLNSGGDNMVRIQIAMANLIKSNSLKAYSFDKATGKISYDETKDGKYYNDEGKLINEAIRRTTWEDNVEVGLQDPNVKELQLGENYRDMNMVKQATDRWIIGSLSEDSRWQLNNHVAGKLITSFRLFSDEKLFRAGVFSGTRNSTLGTGYKVVKDEYGNEISYVEIQQLEGILQSMGAAIKEIRGWQTAKDFWQNASEERRMNLSRAIVKLAISLIFFAMFKMMLPDDEDKEAFRNAQNFQKMYKFLYEDMWDLMVIGDVFSDPIPSMRLLEDVMGVVLNDKEWSTIWSYVPGANSTVGYLDKQARAIEAISKNDWSDYEEEEKPE